MNSDTPASTPSSAAQATPAGHAALVFDWGNTLMKVFPQYSGPMAGWPEVAEVEGIVEALEGLHGSYTMVVATNAADSTSADVWKALRRVGLGEYFKAVFTSHELGSKKPAPAFYSQLESVLDRSPRQMIMIGDGFAADVLGAKAAGWRAVWYNADWQTAPGLLPLQDGEIHHMRDLPLALARPPLPDYATCLAWLLARDIPYNILDHIQLVAALAYQLAVWLGAAGEAVNPLLTHRGALLHDLAKIDSIRSTQEHRKHIDHAKMASDLLIERGQPELAEIANRHMPYSRREDPRRPLTWEQKLVHYADKLSEGARLVTLDERLQALKGRYPQHAQDLEQSAPLLASLQQEICDRLGLTPAALMENLRRAVK